MTSPDVGKTSYWYDAAGNLLSRTDAGGLKVTYLYDSLNRLTTASFPISGEQAAYSITYGYDQRGNGKGRLTDIAVPSGATVLNYNGRGRLKERTATIGASSFTLLQDITPGGRVTRSTYPGGRVIDYVREGCPCRVNKINSTFNSVTTTLVDNLTYRPFGEAAGMSAGNGRTVNNLFDLNGRMTTANPMASKERSFTYDAAGRLTAIAATGTPWFNRTYTYDALNRLIEALGPFGAIQYGYDRVGNRLTENRNGLQTTHSYLEGNNRVGEISGFPATAYRYDARGNIVGIGGRDLLYNQDNRLVQVKEGTKVLGEYQYNAFGERVKKTADGATTLYLYDFDGNLIAETDSLGKVLAEYLYRGRVRLAKVVNGSVYYYHNDQLGTPELMTNAAGTVVWEALYKPFGDAEVNPSSTQTNHFRFQGQYYETETGLHFNHHRYYDPKTGRYLTPDPIGLAGGINPYIYVSNDPVNVVDPLGLQVSRMMEPLRGGGLGGGGAGVLGRIGGGGFCSWAQGSGTILIAPIQYRNPLSCCASWGQEAGAYHLERHTMRRTARYIP